MTRKDAIDRLDIIVSKHEVDDVYITLTNEKDYKALKVAINSLRIDERYELEYEQMQDAYSKGYNDGITIASYKIRAEIDKQERWLLQAGYTAYNADIAFDAIKSVLVESEDKE